MKAWIERVFSFNLRALLAVVLAVGMMLVTTACSQDSPSASGTGSYYQKKAQNTELYDTIQPRKGGMNQYEDTDPRRNIQ